MQEIDNIGGTFRSDEQQDCFGLTDCGALPQPESEGAVTPKDRERRTDTARVQSEQYTDGNLLQCR